VSTAATRPVVLLAEKLAPSAVSLLGDNVEIRHVDGTDRPALLAALADADALLVRSATKVDAEVFAASNRLKVVARAGVGLDNVDVPAATARGVMVVNAPTSNIVSAAEHAIALLLSAARHIPAADASLRQGQWKRSSFTGVELAGKTVGIVGFGHIGREVARRARAFGVTVGAITRTPHPSELTDWVAPMSALEARLPECDFIVIACPLNAATRGLIDRRRLGLMKRSAVLINVARGEVVAEDALYEALRDRIIAGAVIDTWYVYPAAGEPDPYPSRRPFHELPNVIMTPHASGWTDKLLDRRWRVMADNLERLAAGQELRNVVHRG